jgi:RNA polymerase-binding transcription factor DksA
MASKKTTVKKAETAKKAPKPAVKQVAKSESRKPAVKAVSKVVPKAAPKNATKPVAKEKAKKTVEKKPAVKHVAEPAKPVKKAEVKKAASKPVMEKKVVAQEPVKAKKAAKVEIHPAKPARKKETAKPVRVVVPKLTTKSSVKYQPDFTKSVLDAPKIEKAKSVIRYSDNDLQEFKEIILRKLDAAKKELAYLQGLITRRDEGGDMDEGRYMTMEDGSVSMEREQLSQLASRQITFIDHLEKALMRVENKTYGICRVTGNLIDKARLRAVPHATLSMEAKSMMNK